MGAEDVRDLLRTACADAGGQKSFAERSGISQQYVCDVLNARREPGQSILDALNLERVVTYRKTK